MDVAAEPAAGTEYVPLVARDVAFGQLDAGDPVDWVSADVGQHHCGTLAGLRRMACDLARNHGAWLVLAYALTFFCIAFFSIRPWYQQHGMAMAPTFAIPRDPELTKLLERKDRSERTVELNVRNLARLRGMDLEIEDVRGTLQKLSDRYKRTTTRTYLSSIVNWLSEAHPGSEQLKQYRTAQKAIGKKIEEQYAGDAKTDSQKKNWVDWDEVLQKRDELDEEIDDEEEPASEETASKVVTHLLLALYTHIAPGRNDYASLRLVHPGERQKGLPRTANYYFLSDDPDIPDRMLINQHKTSRKSGPRKVTVPPPLRSLVRRRLRLLPNSQTWLLPSLTQPEEPLGKAAAAMRLARLWPTRRVGVCLIRKACKTEWTKRGLPRSADLARNMAHGLACSESFYDTNAKLDRTLPNSMGIYML